jgi:hypothetical protein
MYTLLVPPPHPPIIYYINDYETTCDERHIFHIFHMLYVFYRAVVDVVPVEFPREILQHLYLFWLFVKRGDMYVAPPVAFVPRAKQQNKYVQK